MDLAHAKLERISNIFLELKLFSFHLVKINCGQQRSSYSHVKAMKSINSKAFTFVAEICIPKHIKRCNILYSQD